MKSNKIFIKTFGCQSNIADSEQLAGLLEKDNQIVDSLDKANIVFLNSCSVKSVTQNKQLEFIKDFPDDKKLIVGGCLPKSLDLKKFSDKVCGTLDTNSLLNINNPRIRKNKDIAIINVSRGCLGGCSYCATKLARGSLRSYSIDDIKKEFNVALREDCNKFYITGQDTGCYGFDIGNNLSELLRELTNIKGNFKIRVGMMNPEHTLKILDDLIEVYKSDKIIKFLHIPVQSGSDKVLKEMNRNYKVEDFKRVVKEFRKNISRINISTDVIVGYPTETEKDFQETLKLIREVKPEVLNISRFSSRPKTAASKLKQINSGEVKKRSKILTEEFNKIKNK